MNTGHGAQVSSAEAVLTASEQQTLQLLGAGHLVQSGARGRWKRQRTAVPRGSTRQQWLASGLQWQPAEEQVGTADVRPSVTVQARDSRATGFGIAPQARAEGQTMAPAQTDAQRAWLATVPPLTRAALRRVDTLQQDVTAAQAVRDRVRVLRVEALELALQVSTTKASLSAMRYFVEFAQVTGFDWTSFGALENGVVTPQLMARENVVLADFACYIVENPRRGETTNTGAYARGVIAEVRTFFELHPRQGEPARRPGSDTAWHRDSKLGSELSRTLDGLCKKYPRRKKKTMPIERRHLLAIKRTLDLTTKWGRTKWAFYTTAWQGARRSAELVRGKKVSGRWDPATDMHTGRLKGERDENGTFLGLRVQLAPSKTDVTGEQGFEMLLPFHATADINACRAILEMCELTMEGDGRSPEQIPLLGDWRPGKNGEPLVYSVIAKELKEDLARAGFGDLAAGTHSLRRGAATALAGIGVPDPILKMIGLWSTNAWEIYTFTTDGGPAQAMLDMANFEGRARRPIRAG